MQWRPEDDLSSVEAWQRACENAQERSHARRLARKRAHERAKYELGALTCALAVLVTAAIFLLPR